MSSMFFLLALGITVLSRVVFYYRYCYPPTDGDFISHLMMVKAIRQNSNQLPERFHRFSFDYNTYPNGFQKLVALLPIPLTVLEKHGGLAPILFDTLLLVWIGLVSQVNGGSHYEWFLLYPLIRLLWGREVRGFQFGERAYGVLFGNVYLASTMMFALTHAWPWLIGSVLGGLVFSTSSKFAWQAVVFISAILTVALQRWDFAVVLMATLSTTALLTRGYNLKVFSGLVLYSRFYRSHRAKRALFKKSYMDWVQRVFTHLTLRKLAYYLFENALAMMVTNFIVIIPFMSILSQSGFVLSPWDWYALAGIILVPIIATEALKFLGQPERYLEFSILPVLVILSRHPVEDHWKAFVAAGIVGLLAVAYQFSRRKEACLDRPAMSQSIQALQAVLESRPPSRVLTIPLKLSYQMAYLLDRHDYIAPFTHCKTASDYIELYERFIPDIYPYPGQDLAGYARQYGLDLIVVQTEGLQKLRDKHGLDYYDFSGFPVLAEVAGFCIYQPNAVATGRPELSYDSSSV